GGEDVFWGHHPTTRNIPNLLRNVCLAWRLLWRHRPDVIVSNGAGLAFPFFLLAPLFGTKTVYVEVYDRIDLPTMTGRLCYALSEHVDDHQLVFARRVCEHETIWLAETKEGVHRLLELAIADPSRMRAPRARTEATAAGRVERLVADLVNGSRAA